MELKIFGLGDSKKYAESIARFLDVPLAEHVEKHFDDGESYLRSDTNVRNADVYVVSNIYSDIDQSVGEKFTELLFFIGALKDASAARISLVTSYLAFARQDRKDRSRAPITTKYTAIQLEAAGANRILTMDIHNKSALENAFRIPSDNLEWKKLLVDYLCGGKDANGVQVKHHIDKPLVDNPTNLVVLSPDIGGMERAEKVRLLLEERLNVEIELAIFNKRRIDGVATGNRIIGDVKDKRVILLDDMIATGGTVKLAAETVQCYGGKMFAVAATHGLFTGNAAENLSKIKRIIISDTIPPFRLPTSEFEKKIHIVPTTEMVARAIRITHEGGSISRLLS